MATEYNEYEKEAYGIVDVIDAPPIDDVIPPIDDLIPPVADDIIPPVIVPLVEDVIIPPIDETPPAYKSKKFIEVVDEKELYQTLNKKYQYESMKPEEKALAFIRQQNPGLDDDEILFLAASDYNIGVEKPDEKEMTDEQLVSWRKQEISRKQLLNKAETYFSEEASKVALPDYDPLDVDPDYKEYRIKSQEFSAQAKEKQDKIQNINTQLETNSKAISEITESIEIDLDESKFAVPVTFKLNEEKQMQLADFAKRYTPTQVEYDKFNDPETGKFDYEGYVRSLAPIAFAKDIAKASIRQAVAQDRQRFIEGELKNSTLRNNDISQTVDVPFDENDHYWSKYGGK